MDLYGIASMSMAMSQASLAQNVQVSVLKKTMDSQEAQALSLVEMMAPPSGHLLDTYA